VGIQLKESANLDCLRAIAVSLVLVDHTSKFHCLLKLGPFDIATLGAIGVTFFFVHTSLVLMMSLERQQKKFAGKHLFWAFYARRFFRIYPLSTVAIALVLIFHIPATRVTCAHVQTHHSGAPEIVSNVLLAQNLTYSKNIIGVLWSLPLEVQMYMFLPFIFVFLPKLQSKWLLLGIWMVLMIMAWIQPMITNRLNLIRYAPCFFPGIITYVLLNKFKPRIPSWLWPFWIVSLALAVSAMHTERTQQVMALVLGLSIPLFYELQWTPVKKFSAWVAKYSYGIYLFHVLCIWFAFQYLSHLPRAAQWAIFIILVAIVSVTFYHLLEERLIRVGSHLTEKWFGRTEPACMTKSQPLIPPA
jgi:peptidoglycan/LPS O-acetylase OafA/YrhL